MYAIRSYYAAGEELAVAAIFDDHVGTAFVAFLVADLIGRFFYDFALFIDLFGVFAFWEAAAGDEFTETSRSQQKFGAAFGTVASGRLRHFLAFDGIFPGVNLFCKREIEVAQYFLPVFPLLGDISYNFV